MLYDKAVVADSLDKLKDLGYEWSTRSGLTISIADVTTPPAKAGLLEQFEGEAAKVESQYDRGIITDDERRQQEIEIWTDATNQVTRGHAGPDAADEVQPHRHDGRLGCPRKRHAGASDRRYAWSRRQPDG